MSEKAIDYFQKLPPSRYMPLPSNARKNPKGNFLWTSPDGKNFWVPPDAIKDGMVTVEPQVCSECMLKTLSADTSSDFNWNKATPWLAVAAVVGVVGVALWMSNKQTSKTL